MEPHRPPVNGRIVIRVGQTLAHKTRTERPCHRRGVRLEPTPGHRLGHCSVVISSEGQEAIVTGDVLYQPIQASLSHVSSQFCWDYDMAIATRRDMLGRAATHHSMIIVAHFAGPTAVYIEADDAWTVEET